MNSFKPVFDELDTWCGFLEFANYYFINFIFLKQKYFFNFINFIF